MLFEHLPTVQKRAEDAVLIAGRQRLILEVIESTELLIDIEQRLLETNPAPSELLELRCRYIEQISRCQEGIDGIAILLDIPDN